MEITVWKKLLSGNMGDGWRDEEEAASAYKDFLGTRLDEYLTTHYPTAQVDVRLTVERASGYGGPFQAIVTDDAEDFDVRMEEEIVEGLRYVADQAWIDFCASETAQSLYATD
jgi:hypothetical protein